MADDTPRPHYDIIRDILGYGANFNDGSEGPHAPPQIERSIDFEARLARSGRGLHRVLSEFERATAGTPDGLVPRELVDAATRLHAMLLDRVERWGLSDVLAPGGDQEVEGRLRRWREDPARSEGRPTITYDEFYDFDRELVTLSGWLWSAEAPDPPRAASARPTRGDDGPEISESLRLHPGFFAREIRAQVKSASDQRPKYDPATLDLGGLHHCLLAREDIIELMSRYGFSGPPSRDRLLDLDKVIQDAPGGSDLEKYVQSKRGEDLTAAMVDKIVRELAVKLCLGFPEVKAMRLVEVVAALNAAEPPPARPPEKKVRDLRETQVNILQAAIELQAINLASAQPFAEIAKKAGVGRPDSRNVRDAKKALRARGFLEARPRTGCWITAEGEAALPK